MARFHDDWELNVVLCCTLRTFTRLTSSSSVGCWMNPTPSAYEGTWLASAALRLSMKEGILVRLGRAVTTFGEYSPRNCEVLHLVFDVLDMWMRRNPALAMVWVKEWGVELLLTPMTTFLDSELALNELLNVLVFVTRLKCEEVLEALAVRGALDKLLAIVDRHPSSAHLQSIAMRCLLHLFHLLTPVVQLYRQLQHQLSTALTFNVRRCLLVDPATPSWPLDVMVLVALLVRMQWVDQHFLATELTAADVDDVISCILFLLPTRRLAECDALEIRSCLLQMLVVRVDDRQRLIAALRPQCELLRDVVPELWPVAERQEMASEEESTGAGLEAASLMDFAEMGRQVAQRRADELSCAYRAAIAAEMTAAVNRGFSVGM